MKLENNQYELIEDVGGYEKGTILSLACIADCGTHVFHERYRSTVAFKADQVRKLK